MLNLIKYKYLKAFIYILHCAGVPQVREEHQHQAAARLHLPRGGDRGLALRQQELAPAHPRLAPAQALLPHQEPLESLWESPWVLIIIVPVNTLVL